MIFAMNRYEGCRLVHCSLPINVERFVWSSSSPKTIRQGAELVQNIFLCADNSSSCSKRQIRRWSGLFFFFKFTHFLPLLETRSVQNKSPDEICCFAMVTVTEWSRSVFSEVSLMNKRRTLNGDKVKLVDEQSEPMCELCSSTTPSSLSILIESRAKQSQRKFPIIRLLRDFLRLLQ